MKHPGSKALTGLLILSVMSCEDCDTATEIRQVAQEVAALSIAIAGANAEVIDRLNLVEGETEELGATALNTLGQTVGQVTPTWSSSDPTVVTVTRSGGSVTALSAGSAQVRAFYQDVSAAVTVLVTASTTPTPPANQVPVAQIVSPPSNTSVMLGDPVTFQGTASDDGSIASHAWDFGDGNTSAVEDPGLHTYTSEGVFDVTYRVTDNEGARSPNATRRITVTSSPPPEPPPDGTLLVASTWDTQGTSDAALFDNGKWADISGWNRVRLEVIPGSAGAPTPNMLRHFVRQNDSDEGWIDMAIHAGISLEIGQRITWRWYQNPQEATPWFTDHGIAIDAGGLNSAKPWFTEDARTATHQRVGWQFANGDQFTINGADWDQQNLALGRWYRFEVQFEQIDQDRFILLPSVWDAATETLIAGPDAWINPVNGTSIEALPCPGDIRAAAARFVGFCGGIDPPGSIRDGVAADYAAVAAVLGAGVGPYSAARGY